MSNISRSHAGETSVGVGAGAAPFAIFKGCGLWIANNVSERSSEEELHRVLKIK
jgi:hypothetical protein